LPTERTRSLLTSCSSAVGNFIHKLFKARSEVINDISGDVTTLFRIVQRDQTL
jgi:hypothetical protein